MRSHLIVLPVLLVTTCLSAACSRTSSDITATAPTPVPNGGGDSQTAANPLPPRPPAPPVVPAPRPPSPNPPGPPPSLPVSDRCDYTKVHGAIGQPASSDLLERARVAAGAKSARFLRPNDIVTREYLASRLNVLLDTNHIVRSMYCG